ncbi:nuclear transport factor 2 family protein [Pseudomonadales bacterium]|jgi:ketosteroid isomerase-like protein|nr:nuclear transport factor 2 family protein [Pseudomonadales bacterium]MDG1661836.1 nuclear transport factor 2 family protein [Pseudomonadales bacterium]MDG2079290.1 nuclear transport factor 2 family protein [Pseudomonadales bacterium]
MATENQEIALNFFNTIGEGNLDGAFEYTTEDVTFRAIGNNPVVSKTFKGKEDILNNCWLKVFVHIGPEGVPLTIKNVGSGENVVFIESIGEAKGRSGMPYNNEYVHVYHFRGGKICSITEHLDTALLNALLEQ